MVVGDNLTHLENNTCDVGYRIVATIEISRDGFAPDTSTLVAVVCVPPDLPYSVT